jgi:multicomponent Na+:H+ antiporter subunit F
MEGGVVQAATTFSFVALSLAGVLAVARLVMGPTLSDRVVALDLIAIIVVGVVATTTVRFGSPVLFQPTVALAMLAFLGTVAFAHYIERRGPS